MAHQLTINGNKVEMASLAGTNPWHGLGQSLKEGASIDEWIVAAGMDWKVQRSAVRYAVSHTTDAALFQKWDDNVVLFRSDNKMPLGLVSDGFKVVQPRAVMEFFRGLCENNGFQMRTAGTLFGGRKYWALADIGKESYIADKRDRVKGRLLLVTAADGSMHTVGKFLAECVVCNNTLTMGLAETGGTVVKVSHRSVFNADDVKLKLGVTDSQWIAFMVQMLALADKKISNNDAADLTIKLVGPDVYAGTNPTIKQIEETQETRGFKKIMALFGGEQKGAGIGARKNTAWAWLNAVTQYADHEVSARSVDNRFNASQFGAGDQLKNDALKIAVNA